MPLNKHIHIALGYFFIIAFLGVIMRLYPIADIPAPYRFIVHTHSHVALLGWVYTAITTLLVYAFLRNEATLKMYNRIFWVTQVTILGMLFSFPFTGYALFSILFSTLFLIASYWFVSFFLKNVPISKKRLPSFKLVRISLWYLILSSIGPWALGAIMTTLGNSSPWYRNAIYFFLHFQYNGWFIVALVGLFFVLLEDWGLKFPPSAFKKFFSLLNAGVILTFFLSVLWMEPHAIFYVLAGMGALLQVIAFGMLFVWVFKNRVTVKENLPGLVYSLLKVCGALLIIKLGAQLLGAVPPASKIISANIDYVISYIHWVFLGIVSLALLAFLKQFQLIRITKPIYWLYLLGFFLTEILIFYRGTTSWLGGNTIENYPEALALSSILLFTAIALLFLQQFVKRGS
ncbi:MAG: hypothetical protein CL605_09200 [Altibacter sp.]|uniref:hypothetical protein n=1 Tax=Altibacter sp. TaxID=2024823 RepID=UPI000C8D1214|nr:hypothetical protein [Altibacter sp.]MAP55064.1 hypothetical protein [Altibacter sp.]